jgi:hypothetical protein
MTIIAGLLTIFMPFIALIVALVMRSGELRPSGGLSAPQVVQNVTRLS